MSLQSHQTAPQTDGRRACGRGGLGQTKTEEPPQQKEAAAPGRGEGSVLRNRQRKEVETLSKGEGPPFRGRTAE